jgi:hypothetical protein
MEDSVSDIAQQECEIDDSHVLSCASILSSAPSRLQSQPELMPARKKRTRVDDTVTEFFLNMAQTVKTFPPFLQAQVKSKVFTAVNSAELLMCNLGNPCRISSTSDYLIPPVVNSNPLWGAQLPVQSSSTSYFPTSHINTPVNPESQDSAHAYSSHQWESPFNNLVDQKPVVASLLSSTRISPSLSSESDPSCDTASSTQNTAQARNK